MPKDTFHDAFSYEGDALEHAGFKRPVDETVPEDYPVRPLATVDRLHREEEAAFLERNEAARALVGLALDEIIR